MPLPPTPVIQGQVAPTGAHHGHRTEATRLGEGGSGKEGAFTERQTRQFHEHPSCITATLKPHWLGARSHGLQRSANLSSKGQVLF